MSFDDLGLDEALIRAVRDEGYDTPTPIQLAAIPAVLNGFDVMAAAQTGTGKTAGFSLPLIQHLSKDRDASHPVIRALVLTPTRELAAQVGQSIETYAKHVDLRAAIIFGGVKINPQIDQLKKGVDVLIATPGRLLDHASQGTLDLSRVEVFVLDEADRMLDMGFIHDIRRVMKLLPEKRQNLLFSATFPNEVKTLARSFLHEPQFIEVSRPNSPTELVDQLVHPVDKSRKRELLSYLIGSNDWRQVLVFTRTKHGANRLATQLEKDGLSSAAIHGNKSQGARTRALADFKEGAIRVLIATDIASRGLDIDQLPHVVNYELPNVSEDYIHRIGRTGRAGSPGHAISLVSEDEAKLLRDIEKLLGSRIERKIIEGHEPGEDVPELPLTGKSAEPRQNRRSERPPRAPRDRTNKQPEGRRQQPGQRSSQPGNSPQESNSGQTRSDNVRPNGRPGQPGRSSGAQPDAGRQADGNNARKKRTSPRPIGPMNSSPPFDPFDDNTQHDDIDDNIGNLLANNPPIDDDGPDGNVLFKPNQARPSRGTQPPQRGARKPGAKPAGRGQRPPQNNPYLTQLNDIHAEHAAAQRLGNVRLPSDPEE